MAKISLSKIASIKEAEKKELIINEEKVIVLTYLPMEQKSAFLSELINAVLDEEGIVSDLREKIYFDLLMIKYYTNINLTENMLEHASKTYDQLAINGIFKMVKDNIPKEEFNEMFVLAHTTLITISSYRLSFAGVLKDTMLNSAQEGRSADELLKQLDNISNNGMLKDVLTKLG